MVKMKQKDNVIRMVHKSMTDQEEYEYIKEVNKTDPDLFIKADSWKKARMKDLKKEGKKWTR